MSHELIDEGKKYRERYYDVSTMHVIVGEKSLTIHMSNENIPERTIVGIGIIENLVTLALAEGIDKEIVSAVIWECSRNKGDLADRLSYLLVR